ncbi:MAG: hypothetical protein LBS20_11485 [Prevotella sp.]|nr:hypothetical protein [Prevotella sp.]
MSILIGIKQAEYIRYISVEYIPAFSQIVSTLKTFYKTSERVKALIELGNLNWLGKSPCNKCKGDNDMINCEAKIRDKKLSPGKHGSCIAKDEKEFVKKLERNPREINCCFLYEDGQWYILVGGHKESIHTIDETVLKKGRLMEGLEVCKYDPNSEHYKLPKEDFNSWNEVKQKAEETNTTYYIFRGDKLLTIITPTPKAVEEAA